MLELSDQAQRIGRTAHSLHESIAIVLIGVAGMLTIAALSRVSGLRGTVDYVPAGPVASTITPMGRVEPGVLCPGDSGNTGMEDSGWIYC